MATDEDPQNFILMYAVGANVSGQIALLLLGGLLLSFLRSNNIEGKGGTMTFQRRTFNTSFRINGFRDGWSFP